MGVLNREIPNQWIFVYYPSSRESNCGVTLR